MNERRTIFLMLVFVVGLASRGEMFQRGSNVATGGTVTWTQMAKFADGRTFVTDGSLSIDAAIAKPATLPTAVLPSSTENLLKRYMTAALPDEFALTDLRAGANGAYIAPTGVTLSGNYLAYLARTMPPPRVRLRMKSDLDPVVIVLNGTAVGLLMPMRGSGTPHP